MPHKKDYKEIISGEPIVKPLKRSILEVCCDCGLNHLTFYHIEVRKGKRVVIQTSYRDAYETRESRKWDGYKRT